MPTYTRRIEASLQATGLTAGSALGYTVVGVGGSTLVARTTSGITEDGTSANYYADVAGWDAAWSGSIVWDAGAGTLAREPFLAYMPQTGDTFARIGAAGAGLTALGDTRLANLDAAVSTRSTLSAAGVWDLATSGHTTSGTFGAAAVAAGGAGDPWSTSLPGSYGAGTAGYIVGNRLDVAASTLATATALATVATNVSAIQGQTTTTGVKVLLGQTGLSPRALDSVADSALTLGDCLVAAACGAAGRGSVVGTAYTVKTPFTGTTIRSFALDDETAPTSRT